LMFGEILGENKLNSVISTLLTIIFITLLFEGIGAVLIFTSLDARLFDSVGERVFFSCFLAISGFCNAGFTIIKEGMSHEAYRFNYHFQLVLTSMFVLGSLGFGTIFNVYTLIKEKAKQVLNKYLYKKSYRHRPKIFTFHSRFVVWCNVVVIVIGTVSYFLMERENSLLQDQSEWGKWVSSIFMVIGVSTGSTGGGVKVTTVALALMNIVALAKGKESIEIYKRKIASESVNKAFAIILLSVVTITFSFSLLNFSDPNQQTVSLLFETISAYTTSGLSLGITP